MSVPDTPLTALAQTRDKAEIEALAVAKLTDLLGTFGFPADGTRKLAALRALFPALMLHLDGDPSPVPDRHAFVDASGEVRISGALNSERIETPTGAVLYLNLRAVADTIRENSD